MQNIKHKTSNRTPQHLENCKTSMDILNVRVNIKDSMLGNRSGTTCRESNLRLAIEVSWSLSKETYETFQIRKLLNRMTVVTGIIEGEPQATYELLNVIPMPSPTDPSRHQFILGNKLDADLDYKYNGGKYFYCNLDLEKTI